MELSPDLAEEAIAAVMPERPVRSFPALLSTEAEATSWARAGAAAGSVVVADYQASARGRAGLPWQVRLGEGLGFSMVIRPDLEPEREGWCYVAAALGIADALGGDARIRWPDGVESSDGDHLAALGVTVQLGPQRTEWAVVTGLITSAAPPRSRLLAEVVETIDRRVSEHPSGVLDAYRPRCVNLGEDLLARMIPLGPAGPQVTGTAVDVLDDGALVLLTARENRVAVRPQNLGVLEPAPPDDDGS